MTEAPQSTTFFCPSPLSWQPADAHVVSFSTEFNVKGYTDALFEEFDISGFQSVQRAVDKRKAEFFAGRFALKMAFNRLGVAYVDIAKGERGEPLLPEGLSGSISHSHGFAIAVLAHKAHIPLVGIDVENIISDKSAQSVLKMVLSEEEASLLEVLGRNLGLTVAFSAKESLYKALYPRVQAFFGFDAARVVSVDEQAQCLVLEMTQTLSPEVTAGLRLPVSYHRFADRVLTYVSSQ